MVRRGLKLLAAVVALLALYLGVTFVQVVLASGRDNRASADAIVVLGAAQWNGKPSPVLAARLDHAAELYRDGVAPVIVVVGGKQQGDRTTQGQAGYAYLRALGVPDEALKVEVGGRDTYTELSATANILRDAGMGTDVVLVTSPYHSLRAGGVAREVGLNPHVSPSGDGATVAANVRETAGVAAGRLVGYRRLSNWR
jgi:uncharacterized SAM-binding protein YcdF (DUF218 family)